MPSEIEWREAVYASVGYCGGSGCPTDDRGNLFGTCRECGRLVIVNDDGTAWHHKQRANITSEIIRGETEPVVAGCGSIPAGDVRWDRWTYEPWQVAVIALAALLVGFGLGIVIG